MVPFIFSDALFALVHCFRSAMFLFTADNERKMLHNDVWYKYDVDTQCMVIGLCRQRTGIDVRVNKEGKKLAIVLKLNMNYAVK